MEWQPEDLSEFDALTLRLSSLRQMDRIEARFDIKRFVAKHGKEKCDEMYAELTKRHSA